MLIWSLYDSSISGVDLVYGRSGCCCPGFIVGFGLCKAGQGFPRLDISHCGTLYLAPNDTDVYFMFLLFQYSPVQGYVRRRIEAKLINWPFSPLRLAS